MLVVGGDAATLWLWVGGVVAAVGPQRELGGGAIGAGRVVAGKHPAANTGRKSGCATGDEVSGADGARQPGRLRTDCGGVRAAALQHAASPTTLCRMAGRLARRSRA